MSLVWCSCLKSGKSHRRVSNKENEPLFYSSSEMFENTIEVKVSALHQRLVQVSPDTPNNVTVAVEHLRSDMNRSYLFSWDNSFSLENLPKPGHFLCSYLANAPSSCETLSVLCDTLAFGILTAPSVKTLPVIVTLSDG
jgi:hypothetical protein